MYTRGKKVPLRPLDHLVTIRIKIILLKLRLRVQLDGLVVTSSRNGNTCRTLSQH